MTNTTIPKITCNGSSFARSRWLLIILFASAYSPSLSFCQQASSETFTESANVVPPPLPLENKRILGIIPNNRTSPSLKDYKPLSPKEKFEIARQDSFDRGTVILAAMFAVDAQLTNANPSFGQGAKGHARYLVHLTETSSLATTCPRQFTRPSSIRIPAIFGVASGADGLGWGTRRSNLLDPHRFRSDSVQLLGDSWQCDRSRDFKRVLSGQPERHQCGDKTRMQIGVDMASNVLKEFWPDVSRRFSRNHRQ